MQRSALISGDIRSQRKLDLTELGVYLLDIYATNAEWLAVCCTPELNV